MPTSSPGRFALALLALSLAAPLAAADEKAIPARKPKKPKASAKVETGPPIYDPDTDAIKQVEASARFCAQSGKKMVLNLGTNACEPCRTVSRAIHEPVFYDAFARDFLAVFIDVTPGSKNAQILKRFGLDERVALPVVIVYDKDVKPVEMTSKGEMTALAAKGEREIQLWLLRHFPKNQER